MKIALFHELPPGGARRGAIFFAKELIKNGHILDLYYVDNQENFQEESFFKKKYFYNFKPIIWKGNNWIAKLYRDTIELLKIKSLHKRIAKEIDEKKYDIAYIHGSRFTQSPFILRFLKTRNVYYAQEPLRMVYERQFEIPNNLIFFKKAYEIISRLVRKNIDRKNISSADKVLTNSKFTKQNVFNAYKINSSVSYMGVDSNIYKPKEGRKKIDILYIGSKHFSDGYELCLKALKLLKNKPKTDFLIKEERWISSDKEISRIYQNSHIVLCFGQLEPFGLIPLEAMACKVLVIAANEGGYKETVVEGKTGFLVQRTPQDIAKKISYLLTNPKRLSVMESFSRKYILDNWTWEKRGKELSQFFRNFIKKS